MLDSSNKSEKNQVKTLPIQVSLEQYDEIQVLKANSGHVRMSNSEYYRLILSKGIEYLKL